MRLRYSKINEYIGSSLGSSKYTLVLPKDSDMRFMFDYVYEILNKAYRLGDSLVNAMNLCQSYLIRRGYHAALEEIPITQLKYNFTGAIYYDPLYLSRGAFIFVGNLINTSNTRTCLIFPYLKPIFKEDFLNFTL